MITQTELLDQIASMSSTSDSDQVRDSMRTFKEVASEEEYELARRALSQRLNELANQFDSEIRATDILLHQANRGRFDE